MAEITMETIKKLREITGAGIMDCKKALAKVEGDFEKAQEILRQKGAEKAEKKKDRATNSGIIETAVTETAAAVVELNCETDFVAKNDIFKGLAKEFAQAVANAEGAELTFETLPAAVAETIKTKLAEAIGKIGENMSLKRCVKISFGENGKVASYVHMGGKIAVLAEIEAASKEAAAAPETAELAKDIAMQVAAQCPKLVRREEFTEEELNKQKQLIADLAKEENPNKPANIVERIAGGKLEKYFQSACLVDQIFIKDSSKNIATLVKEVSKKVGAELTVKRFVRFSLGE